MARRRTPDGVQRLGDSMKRRVRTDRHVSPRHVVIDRSHQTHQTQERMQGRDLRGHLTGLDQLRNHIGPLLSEQVRRGQAAVAPDHYKGIDPAFQQVTNRLAPTPLRTELATPATSNVIFTTQRWSSWTLSQARSLTGKSSTLTKG